jgi:hypothetical protein
MTRYEGWLDSRRGPRDRLGHRRTSTGLGREAYRSQSASPALLGSRTRPEQQAASAYAGVFQEEGAHLALTAWITDDEAWKKHREALGRSDREAMLNYYKRNYPRASCQEGDWMRIKVRSSVLIIHGLRDPYLLPGRF